MENLKCPKCGKPMGVFEKTGYYVSRGLSYIFKFKAMRCEDHPKEHFQTEAQMIQILDTMKKIKARASGRPRQ